MEPQQEPFETFGQWLVTRLIRNMAPSRETPAPDLYHFFTDLYADMLANPGDYLRWKLESPVTPRLFARLDKTAPGLADRVFAGIKPCAHCYGEGCMARAHVERGGVNKEVCGEAGWNVIGFDREGYAGLWTVITELDQLVTRKPQM